MNIKAIVKKYEDQELWPPIPNVSLFVWGSGWNSDKYFKIHKDKTPSGCVVLIDDKESYGLFLSLKKIRKIFTNIFSAYLKDKKALKKIDASYRKIDQEISQLYEKYTYADIEKKETKELEQMLFEITDKFWSLNGVLNFSAFPVDKEYFLSLENVIGKKELERIWEKAVLPIRRSFDEEKKIYLMKEIIKGSKNIFEDCQFFYSDYYRVINLQETEKRIKKDYAFLKYQKTRIKGLVDRENKKERKKIRDYADWVSKLKRNEKRLVDFLQYVIRVRDLRKNSFGRAITIMYRIGEELLSRAGVKRDLLPFITIWEMGGGLEYLKKNEKIFQKRKKGALFYKDNLGLPKIKLVNFSKTKKEIDGIFYEMAKNKNLKDNLEIEGKVGAPGLAKGRVKKIITINKKSNLKKGEVLVTTMTRPEFIPFMKKAVAIIADEGGVTSHAAIVSRELGIPCVIGTKNATKVLKDGQLVEVDANKGVVKILKKK